MRTLKTVLATTSALVALGYENETGWKKNADGSLVTDGEGNPVLIGADGKETTVGPGYINRLNTESAKHRKDAREAEAKLTAFGDLDPRIARDAVDKIKDVDFDKLVNKGEIETVRTQMREQYERDIKERDDRLTAAEQRVNSLTLNNAFNSSEFLNKRLALPADVVQATFRDRFKVEDGKIVPLTDRGEPLINKHGDVASVDEAFETYITARPDKDTWLKAPEVGGSGSQGGGGGRGGGNTMKRAAFDALTPLDQAAIGQRMAKGEVQIVD